MSTNLSTPAPPSNTPETAPGLKESVRAQIWSKRLFWSLVGGVMVLCLGGAFGSIWLLSNLLLRMAPEPRNSQTFTPTIIAETAAQIEPSRILLESVPTNTPPLPSPVPSPTATKVVDAQNFLDRARAALQLAQTERNRQQAQTALELLDQAEPIDPTAAAEVARLRSEINFALDALDGTIYLTPENMTGWSLKTDMGETLLNPIDMTISNDGLYVIDRGTLYRSNWPLSPTNGQLTLTPILTSAARVNGYPVKEIVAVEATNTKGDVFVLDKSNDIYRYRPISNTWQLETPASSQYSQPDPLYLNLSSYDDRLYLLDPARNQIWRHPPSQAGSGFLPGTLPWLIKPGEPDVNSGIDLAIDGSVYVLQRDGVVVTYSPQETARFSLATANDLSRVPGWTELPVQPIAIFATVEGDGLHVADPGRRRVVTFDRTNGRVLQQLIAPDNPNFAALHSIAEKDGQLYILAGPNLYSYYLDQELNNPPSLAGQLPAFVPSLPPDQAPGDLLPNDPRLPDLLAAYRFKMPLADALLPDRSAIYPGSRRTYRYDVHQGLDLYGKDIGIEMTVGTPVYAAADGTVIQADTDYREMTLDEINGLLADANARHYTPPDTLAKLNGRQVWIDHGGGIVTRYSHLSDIAEDLTVGQAVKADQLIGYVGLSGTPDGISGNYQFPHLHFEMRLGHNHEFYFGQWLTIEETRRAFEHIFNVPVRPAYLEFREGEG